MELLQFAAVIPVGLSTYARQFLTDEQGARKNLSVPMLVWESPIAPGSSPLYLGTATGAPVTRPRATEPVVFEVKKGDSKQNAFSMGITVGRTENNDVIIDDNSISRFHAYFQQDPRSGEWRLADAESKNGTWVGPLKLVPKRPQAVPDQTPIRFGDIVMEFLMPDSFFEYLQRLMNG